MATLSPDHRQFLEHRGISADIAEQHGFYTKAMQGEDWLAAAYVQNGQVVNTKYRATSDKRFRMDKGGKLILWNHDCLLEEGNKPVVITEGECDALAVIIAKGGDLRAVSVPNGASGGDGELAFIEEASDLLDRFDSFIIATDSDEAGRKLRANLVRHLGADRCAFVESYGADCKDLNDTLMHYGPEAVSEILLDAKPYPVKGLYTIDDFPERPELAAWPTGLDVLNDLGDHRRPALAIVPGTLTVATGYAGAGKTTLVDIIVGSHLKRGIPVTLASFESDVKPILLDGIRAAMLGIGHTELRSADLSEVDPLIREKLHIISQQVEEVDEMDIGHFLALCRVSVLRHGVRLIILDPWNELEHRMRGHETETAYIGRALRAIKHFAKVYDVAFWVVAHPTKPFEGRFKMPALLDISGSANWANKPDFGLSYHRATNDNLADLCVTKVRKGYPGRRGSVKVRYDFRTSAIVEAEAKGSEPEGASRCRATNPRDPERTEPPTQGE